MLMGIRWWDVTLTTLPPPLLRRVEWLWTLVMLLPLLATDDDEDEEEGGRTADVCAFARCRWLWLLPGTDDDVGIDREW